MSDDLEKIKQELAHQQERARLLALEKSHLELLIHLMNRVSAVPGLENMIDDLLATIIGVIGGENIILYYKIDDTFFYTDVYGQKKLLDRIEDELVQRVFESKEPIQQEHPFTETRMQTNEFTRAYTWVYPLLVGDETIGVLKMTNLHIGMLEMRRQLPTFFNYAALLLKNRVQGYTRLKQAYDALAQEVAVRREAEIRLQQANEQLEIQVTERTADLRDAKEELERFFTLALDLFCIADTNGNFRKMNLAWEKTLGFSREKLMSGGFLDFVHPDDHAATLAAIEQLIDQKQVRSFLNRFRCRDGSYRWIEWNSSLSDKLIYAAARDITERKRAEEARRQTEEMWTQVFVTSPAMIFVTSLADGRLKRVNPAFEKALGYSQLEVLRLTSRDFSAWPGPEVRAEFLRELAEQGFVKLREGTFRRKDGQQASLLFSTVAMEYEGQPCLLNVAMDVTEYKRTKALLRESLEIWEKVFAINPVLTAVTTMDEGRFLRANATFLKVMGYSWEEMLGRTALELGFWDNVEERSRFFMALRVKDQVKFREASFSRKDGQTITVLWWSVPIEFEGRRSILSLGLDITERKRVEEALRVSQEKFRTVANFTYDWEYWRGPVGELVWVSPSCERVTGYSEAEFMANSQLLEKIIHPEDTQSFREHIREISTGRPEIRSIEFRIIHRSGRVVWIDHRCAPIVNPDGVALGRRVCNRDITEHKRVEAERQKLETQLRQSQKMEAIGTLAGGIAHDFNNILAAIIGYSQLALMDTVIDSSMQDKLSKILAAGLRAKELVQQILRFSRRTEQEHVPIEINPIIKETLKLLRASLPSTIELNFNEVFQEDVVIGDAIQIHQLLLNLCTNAAHAMRETGGFLEVSLERTEIDHESVITDLDLDPGAYLKLTVADTGHGMDKETLERIFEPFYTTKALGEGTGMGLSVVHGIVKCHRGAIKVQSQVGVGTIFNVFLPLAESIVSERSAFTSIPLPTGTERILFVDDEPNLVDWSRELFERLGYRVTSCLSSLEAFSLFQASPHDFDLVITDQTMPNLTGTALAQKILKIRPDIPIILCTGFSQQVTPEIAVRLGIKRLLMKPLVLDEVAHVLRAVLDERKE